MDMDSNKTKKSPRTTMERNERVSIWHTLTKTMLIRIIY